MRWGYSCHIAAGTIHIYGTCTYIIAPAGEVARPHTIGYIPPNGRQK